MKGKGIATAKHTGDLIVTVDVQVPTELTAEQRAAVEALACGDYRVTQEALGGLTNAIT